MNEQWEYKIVYWVAEQWTKTGLPAEINEHFDRLGMDRWELVGTEAITRPSFWRSAGTTAGILGFFKRRLQD